MMNSVGAEKDPYLQAYIQARMKNHVEEVKLQKVLANLEVGRRIKKIMLNMELFEDRKMAHKLKKEASDVESHKSNVIQKYLTNRTVSCFDKLHPNARIFSFTNTSRSFNLSSPTDVNVRDSVPASSTKRTSIFPVTTGNATNGPLDAKSALHGRHRTPRHSLVSDHHNHHNHHNHNNHNNHIAIAAPSRLGELSRRRSMRIHDNAYSDTETPGGLNSSSKSLTTISQANARLRSGAESQFTTPAIRVEDTNATERLKTAATVPARVAQKEMDKRSARTLPTLLPSQTSPPGSPTKCNRPKTSSLWPGDPNAIRSVRRDRRKPEEMLSNVKNGEEARRMIRDMPPTCSKNCSKPDILQELGRSYTDLPNLLPAIEKARHAFACQEAANRDTPGNGVDEEELGCSMPVSQIQYSALRSMGGVRRNSVIA